MKPVRVLLVDRQELFRAGIRLLLEKLENIEVVGDTNGGREAQEWIRKCPPDIVLMDMLMSELYGLDATARVATKFSSIRVIILSMKSAEGYVLQAIRGGAAGYLLKSASPAELELAIKAVARGETYLCSTVSKYLIKNYVKRIGGPENADGVLTPRQREVLQLIVEGCSNKAIAKILNLSIKTIEMHRSQLMAALDIHDIPGLVRYAIRAGLISAEI